MPRFPLREFNDYMAAQKELFNELLAWLQETGVSPPEEIRGTLLLTELRREELVAAVERFEDQGGE